MSNSRKIVSNDMGSLAFRELVNAYKGMKFGKVSLPIGVPAVASTRLSNTLAATDGCDEIALLTVTEPEGLYIEDVTAVVDTTATKDATAYSRIYIGYRESGDVSTTWVARGSTYEWDALAPDPTGHGFGTITAWTPVSFARDIVTGYGLSSTVTIVDGGTGAGATGTLAITNGGGSDAAGTFTAAGGVIGEAWITDSGYGFTDAGSVTVTPDSGTGSDLTVALQSDPIEQKFEGPLYLPQYASLIVKVDACSVLDFTSFVIVGGATYAAGDILFDGGGGAMAVGTYTVVGGAITTVVSADDGHGFEYGTVPTLTPSDPGGGGVGGSITAVLDTAGGVVLSNLVLTVHYRIKGNEIVMDRDIAVGYANTKNLLSDIESV